jgi:hypothetical protein
MFSRVVRSWSEMVILVDNQTPEKEKKYVYLTIFNLNFNMRNVL